LRMKVMGLVEKGTNRGSSFIRKVDMIGEFSERRPFQDVARTAMPKDTLVLST
jgi:hypothetical protein